MMLKNKKIRNQYIKSENINFNKIFLKTLNFNPEYRFSNINEFINEIYNLIFQL